MDVEVPKSGHEPLPSTAPTERTSMMSRDPGPETPKMAHDSMVTVRLSEPESIVLDSPVTTPDLDTNQSTPTKVLASDEVSICETPEPSLKRTDTIEEVDEEDEEVKTPSTEEATNAGTPRESSPTMPPPILTTRSLREELADDGHVSDDQEEVNWEQLEKTEDEQTKDEETDNVSYYYNLNLKSRN